jgi:hypothetical protein
MEVELGIPLILTFESRNQDFLRFIKFHFGIVHDVVLKFLNRKFVRVLLQKWYF